MPTVIFMANVPVTATDPPRSLFISLFPHNSNRCFDFQIDRDEKNNMGSKEARKYGQKENRYTELGVEMEHNGTELEAKGR